MSKATSLNWEQVKELFVAVLARPFAERDAFLAQACAGDHELRNEVESLIKSYEQASSFLEAPAVEASAESFVTNEERLTPGQRVAHYEIFDVIGEGGMGEVYLARDTKLGRRVALKLLPEYIPGEADRLRRFKQEARAASTLSHPNVCVIHEVGESESGRHFIAMEYVEGTTLRQRIDSGALKLSEALEIGAQIADALAAAHEDGIVHRDIKPENIMIRPDGYVKVLDFGLAKLTEKPRGFNSETATTLMRTSTPGLVMGTVAYMSPEQARGVTVDTRTDIWSLGVVLYEMVSRRAPFVGETPTDVVVAIVEKEQPSLSDLVAELPPELERIVRKALRKNREERYQLARELAIDLRSLRRDLEVELELGRSHASSAAAVSGSARRGARTGAVAASDTAAHGFAGLTGNTARLALMAVALIAITGFGLLAYKFLGRKPAAAPSHFQRFQVNKLTTNGNALFASISRDGKYVAYVMNEAGKQSLWLRQAAVDSSVRIMPPRDGEYLGTAFSSDGNYLFYGYAGSGSDAKPALYRIPVLSSGATPVRMNLYTGPLATSHDGKKVAFYRYDEAAHADVLVLANTDGNNEQTIATANWPEKFGFSWDATPAWSADDAQLTSVQVNTTTGSFFLSMLDVRLASRATNTVTLTGQRFELLDGLAILPDTTGVIATAKAQGASFFQLWQLSRDGSARQITSDLSDYLGLGLTADAKALLTIQRQVLSNIWTAANPQAAPTAITSGAGRYFDLCWAPDGKILYASDASGSANIYEMGADGSNIKALTDAGRNYAPAVSPDGRFIAFHSNRSGTFQIWLADRDGGNPRQLTSGASESHWPQFSNDGRWVFYEHYDYESAGSLWKISVNGGEPIRLSQQPTVRLAVSPDGKWLAAWVRDKQPPGQWRLGILPSAGGTPAQLFAVAPTVQISWDAALQWTGDSSAVTYIDHRGGVENLWAQPLAGGPAKPVTDFKENRIFSFAWSHDGRLLASRGVQTNDVVLISETP